MAQVKRYQGPRSPFESLISCLSFPATRLNH